MCCNNSSLPVAFCESPLFKINDRPRLPFRTRAHDVTHQRSMHRLHFFYAARKLHHESSLSDRSPSLRIPRVVIIGGGAAGHMAAISCARRVQQGASVCIIESSKTVLDKVRISGGGRCNVTSALDAGHDRSFVSHYPRGRQEMLSVIAAFNSMNTISFFEEEGVRLKTEPTGKVFPVSDSSESVVNALAIAARKSGVHVLTSTRVMDLKRIPESALDCDNMMRAFQLDLSDGRELDADYIVVATGSARLPWTWASALGHHVLSGVPSLFTFKVHPWKWTELAGISVDDVHMSLVVDPQTKRKVLGLSQRGPVLITHWGLSGPVVLTLSAFGARVLYDRKYTTECVVDWIPSMSAQEKEKAIEEMRKSQRQKQVDTSCPFWRQIPKRLWRVLVEEALDRGDDRGAKIMWGSLSAKEVKLLASQLHEWRVRIQGRGQFKEEFVTAGGVAVSDVDTKTFESKLVSGLYFAGETMNVDGCTGGYNLQFAWSSGFIAGSAIADRIKSQFKVDKLLGRRQNTL